MLTVLVNGHLGVRLYLPVSIRVVIYEKRSGWRLFVSYHLVVRLQEY